MEWPKECLVNGTVATIDCIPHIFSLILNFLVGFSGIVALFFILFAGFKFIASGGDAKQVQGARQTLTYAIIGLVVVILSFAIINIIASIIDPNLKNCLINFGFLHCK